MSTVEVVKMHGLLELSVNQLRFDTDVQCRASIDSGTVTEYKEALTANVVFPPLVVFHDGTIYWVADGFHRGSAYRESGATKCPCDVRQGTKRDAILYACGANQNHGLRRTQEDKRRAVETVLKDAEWRANPTRWIAERCGVHHSFVARLKDQLSLSDNSEPARVTGSDGKSYLAKHKPTETKPVEKVVEEPVREREPELEEEGEDEEEDFEEPAPVVAKDLTEANEAAESIRLAKKAISEIWFRCPAGARWRLKGGIENHLADLSEG